MQSIGQALVEMRQAPIHDAMKLLLSQDNIHAVTMHCLSAVKPKGTAARVDAVHHHFTAFANEVKKYIDVNNDVGTMGKMFERDIEALATIWQVLQPVRKTKAIRQKSDWESEFRKTKVYRTLHQPGNCGLLLAWLVADKLSYFDPAETTVSARVGLIARLNLEKPFRKILSAAGRSREQSQRDICLLRIMTKHRSILTDADEHNRFLRMEQLFDDYDVREFIKVNFYNETWFYNKECFADMMHWLFLVSLIHDWKIDDGSERTNALKASQKIFFINEIERLSDRSEYDIEKLRKNLLLEES